MPNKCDYAATQLDTKRDANIKNRFEFDAFD